MAKFGDKFLTVLLSALDAISKKLPWLSRLKVLFLKARPVGIFLAGLMLADLAMLALVTFRAPPPPSAQAPRKIIHYADPYVQELSAYEFLVHKNLFCPGCPVPDIQRLLVERPKDCNKAQNLGTRPKLIGTVVLSQKEFSVAILEDGGDSKAIQFGENFQSFGKVFEIRRNRVCFEGPSGALSYVELPDELIQFTGSAPAPQQRRSEAAPAEEVIIDRKMIVEALADPQILTKALARPERDENGNMIGFKILSIEPGSVYEKLIKVADVITHVNGEPVSNFQAIQDLWSNAATVDTIDINVIRGGRPTSLKFRTR